MDKNSKIYVAGHRGLVGSALKRRLESKGYSNLILRTHKELDLANQQEVNEFFEREKPEYVFLAAAKVGGILANNTYPAEFIYENLMIEANIIHASYRYGVKKLLFLGSSCIYPKLAPQPLKEEYLLTGPLEETNEAYAIAKIAGIRLCKHYNQQYGTNFISVMPTNLYGPNDNFDLETSHVMPALIRKFYEAKINNEPEVIVWGTGKPLREFMHVNDMADACVYLMENYDYSEIGEFVNIGVGEDVTISELVELIREIVGFEGKIKYDTSKPDGTPRKLMDVSRLNKLGWKAKISLKEGIRETYEWYILLRSQPK
ncbi:MULTISPECIES: GDP-L-fucose synthase [Methanosarcina]|uniref:GDP-L-fucose synthase n=1 Tax=Methanosarcina vacuolata Z-761 TaxID=1434123 RepID=A0A0E3Q3K3_9EURY|nr:MULTISPECIES: GDP-L-fucose synthase [Methanosarcina]AKB43003.1 GDP-L-fucose synthetase [Methanosarcina vacuolata Z-761]AKB46494.1 GDP-L-fucose synthetase [Methanosarcina sp. Kolksee]